MRWWGAILCALWCIVCCIVIGVRTQDSRAFDTDIQNLLPQNALEPVIRAAIGEASAAASGRVTVLVSGADPARVEAAAADLEHRLSGAGFTSSAAEGEAIGRWLFANRNALLCEANPAQFDAHRVVQRSQALLYAPMSPVSGALLRRDPFLLTLQLAQCLSPLRGGHVGDAVVVSGALNASAFRIDVQDAVTGAYDAWKAHWPDVSGARAGAVFYAEDGANETRNEIALIGGVSLVGTLVLLFACFGTIQSITGTLAVTAAGGLGSLAVALLLFPSVHVLVFVFGSALIGVTSDYALHYLATGPQTGWAPAKERLKLVSRPLAVCALATSLGFASLALFGVSIFNQVAVFSVAGILTAWWFTVTLLPLMDWRPRKSQRPKLTAWWARVEAPFLAFRWKRWHSIAAGGLTAIILVAGLARFSVLDDVRQFQPRSPELAAEEARVREASGVDLSPSFLLSYGDSADQARQREEATLARWPGDAAQAALAVSRFDPSAQRRASNEALLRTQLFEPYLAARVEQLGLVDADPFAAGTPTPLPPTIARLQGVQGNTHYVVAPLGASAARAANRDTALGEGSRLVDPAARYSQAFTSFRNLAMGAVVLAFGVCVLIVLALYRTWRALIVLAAPAVGLAFAVLVPSAFGVPASFFSVSALFVVIGAGIDHSVFTFESEETHGQAKELAVFLAALTTILSMGLLAVSHTYPVASFGIAVCAGVTAAYLFSFVPLNSVGSGKHGNK